MSSSDSHQHSHIFCPKEFQNRFVDIAKFPDNIFYASCIIQFPKIKTACIHNAEFRAVPCPYQYFIFYFKKGIFTDRGTKLLIKLLIIA